ncbi:multidrug effflux MFS transporter [Bordetella sp. N]|uniref:multidrug effflux MFS transporter n=1 Tax=Bordetella sp. N TaxID=1746199 RepID=UPI00070F066D|nr:multidrug effflux MFS transporter [Bordetella sp. N]ALM82270.1 hypothetical protein ASB57_04210 [Bordetella sp. N]
MSSFTRRHIPAHSAWYVVMLGFLSALPPLGIDMGLPALPDLQADLGIPLGEATLTMTLFLAGFAFGPLMSGPLSDRYGRKPVMLTGIAIFSIAGLGCAWAPTATCVLGMRTLQGIGAGAAAALPAAIVRDAYSGHMALKRQSYVALVNAIGPLVAPLIGVTVMRFGDWRTIYATLGVVGVVLFLVIFLGYAETAPGRRERALADTAVQQPHVLAAAFTAYRQVLRDKHYLLSTGVLAMTFGAMFSYISSSSIVFMGVMGVSAGIYAMLFALSAIGGIAGAACNARLAPRFGEMRMLYTAVGVSLLASLTLALLAALQWQTVAGCAALVVLNNFCAGVAMPNATHQALQRLGKVAGSAAALQRSLQMAFGALASALVGILSPNPVMGMAASMVIFAALSCLFLIIRHRLAE